MEWINSILAILTGLFLRLVVPIVITLLVVYLLHKADVRWQEDAVQNPAPMVVESSPCREIKKCPFERSSECPSVNSAKPCWQARRLSNGYLREECLNCQVFHQAPIPVPVHS